MEGCRGEDCSYYNQIMERVTPLFDEAERDLVERDVSAAVDSSEPGPWDPIGPINYRLGKVQRVHAFAKENQDECNGEPCRIAEASIENELDRALIHVEKK